MEVVDKQLALNDPPVTKESYDKLVSAGFSVEEAKEKIAKNYLSKEELKDLEGIVSAFLEMAENRARRYIPMSMEDWSLLIDKYLLLDERDILKDAGKISHEIACDKALMEFEKYRIKQDKIYKSDFDLLIEESNK